MLCYMYMYMLSYTKVATSTFLHEKAKKYTVFIHIRTILDLIYILANVTRVNLIIYHVNVSYKYLSKFA